MSRITVLLDDPFWSGRRLTVLGLSGSGMAVATYAARRGANVLLSESSAVGAADEATARDADIATLDALGCHVETGGHSDRCVSHATTAVLSPGISPHTAIVQRLQAAGVDCISEVEFAATENQRTRALPVIGITGTNGKTTTTSLLASILAKNGIHAIACGNIGLPMTTALEDPAAEVLIAELSSYQLAFSPTLRVNGGVWLNLAPDHLAWHGGFEAYRQAKRRLITGSLSEKHAPEHAPDWIVLNATDPESDTLARQATGPVVWFGGVPKPSEAFAQGHVYFKSGWIVMATADQGDRRIVERSTVPLIGHHNTENLMAAIAAAAQWGVPDSVIAAACQTFPGVPHRLEYVATLNQGDCKLPVYNDSKATNVHAGVAALKAFESTPIVLIAGGRPKNDSLDPWVSAVKAHCRAVVLLGEAAPAFAGALEQAGYTHVTQSATLDEATDRAIAGSVAAGGLPVVLSPACASFDQFVDFEARGDAFKQIIHARMATTPPVEPAALRTLTDSPHEDQRACG